MNKSRWQRSNKNWHNKEERQLNNLKRSKEQRPVNIRMRLNKGRKDKDNKDRKMYNFIRRLSGHSVQILILTTIDHVCTIWKSYLRKKNLRETPLIVEVWNGRMWDKSHKKEREDFTNWTKDQNKEADKRCWRYRDKGNFNNTKSSLLRNKNNTTCKESKLGRKIN